MNHFKNLSWICNSIASAFCFCFFFFFWPGIMWDLSSPNRYWTHTPCIRRQSFNHWTVREVTTQLFLKIDISQTFWNILVIMRAYITLCKNELWHFQGKYKLINWIFMSVLNNQQNIFKHLCICKTFLKRGKFKGKSIQEGEKQRVDIKICWLQHPGNFLVQFSSVQWLSHVQLFATPWTAARHASLCITNAQSLPKLMSIESVMPSNQLILCRPLLLLPSIFPRIRVSSNESVLHIRWLKYWSFSFQHQSFQSTLETDLL